MTLVDTSAWIEFFRGKGKLGAQVDELLLADEVALCGPVLTELRRGLRTTERARILPLLEGCQLLEQPELLWEEAGELGSLARARGATVASMDLLIATYALAHRTPVLTSDSDFKLLQKLGLGLELAPY